MDYAFDGSSVTQRFFGFLSLFGYTATQSGYPDTCKTNWECVAKMETAGFTSPLWVNSNNPWGMEDANGRENTQNGIVLRGTERFGTYADAQAAANDIVLWMNAANFPKAELSLADHVAAMGARGYFGTQSTDSYLKLVQAWVAR